MNSEYIVEMRNITKSFPGIIANDDVTIQVRKGEVYALLGENGAGKSTLMSMLYGMYEPDRGEIYIRGEKVVFKSPSEAVQVTFRGCGEEYRYGPPALQAGRQLYHR